MKAAANGSRRAIKSHELRRLIGVVYLILSLCACANPLDRAQRDLRRRGIGFDGESFLEAVRADERDVAQLFVEAGFEPSRALAEAARGGRCRALAGMIDGGANVGSLDGARALAFALAGENAPCVEILLAAGARLEARDEFGETLLHKAARLKQPELLRFLIGSDQDLNARSRTGQTPLMVAAGVGREGNAMRLAAAGADLEARDLDGWTALIIAVRQDRQRLAQRLIDLGADVNAVSGLGWTPLMWASLAGREDLVEALLNAGAVVGFSTRTGHSALILATRRGHLGVVEKLLAAKEDES